MVALAPALVGLVISGCGNSYKAGPAVASPVRVGAFVVNIPSTWRSVDIKNLPLGDSDREMAILVATDFNGELRDLGAVFKRYDSRWLILPDTSIWKTPDFSAVAVASQTMPPGTDLMSDLKEDLVSDGARANAKSRLLGAIRKTHMTVMSEMKHDVALLSISEPKPVAWDGFVGFQIEFSMVDGTTTFASTLESTANKMRVVQLEFAAKKRELAPARQFQELTKSVRLSD